MNQNFNSKQLLTFLLTGGLSTAVNLSSRIFYNYSMDFSSSIILASITGMITSFILLKLFVFKQSNHSLGRSALSFFFVSSLASMQTWYISILLADHILPALQITSFVHEIAHFVGTSVPVFTSYLGYKYWAFR